MEEKNSTTNSPAVDTQAQTKQPYTPPDAQFVPLKVEERLLACKKTAQANCAIINKNS
jgi:hypothetical protein